MIDAQSIAVATAATGQVGNGGESLRQVIWHSIALASIVGLIVILFAHLFPGAVPSINAVADHEGGRKS